MAWYKALCEMKLHDFQVTFKLENDSDWEDGNLDSYTDACLEIQVEVRRIINKILTEGKENGKLPKSLKAEIWGCDEWQ